MVVSNFEDTRCMSIYGGGGIFGFEASTQAPSPEPSKQIVEWKQRNGWNGSNSNKRKQSIGRLDWWLGRERKRENIERGRGTVTGVTSWVRLPIMGPRGMTKVPGRYRVNFFDSTIRFCTEWSLLDLNYYLLLFFSLLFLSLFLFTSSILYTAKGCLGEKATYKLRSAKASVSSC